MSRAVYGQRPNVAYTDHTWNKTAAEYYGHSCHHLLHKITVLEIDLTIDSYLTAFLE